MKYIILCMLQIAPLFAGEIVPADLQGASNKPTAGPADPVKDALLAYLDHKFPATIRKVSVGREHVRIEGNTGMAADECFLADIPMDVLVDDPNAWQTLVEVKPGGDGSFLIDIPRHRQRDGRDYDRLTSRWQLVRKTNGGIEALSHARYAEWVECRAPDLPAARPANKKGLGGWHHGRMPDELKTLGISAVTVNVLIHNNWIDNRGEGGLKIGLRKFPDEPGDPLGKKPIWHLYQALGTPREDTVAAPYLKTIGLASWDQAIHREPIR